MPRKASGKREQQRLRQKRYRASLVAKREPEVAELDTAVAAAVARLVVALEDKTVATGAKSVLDKTMIDAVDHLKTLGYSGRSAGKLLYRRLTWLKESYRNPSATNLQKRGCYL
ncbi:hypothetical protein [Neorhizobium sp. T6_25]|uniref:hypothetical protein n=1 Tax=Neorhizobium sp. T6_25 TaxID=2093833 RepID=UPI000CF869E3|nr:hypothetical protein [Neorhizobium sp. T6_25]